MIASFGIQAPGDRLDYAFDFSLRPGEALSGTPVTAAAPSDLTVAVVQPVADPVVVWIEGGTPDTVYRVTCEAATSQGRTVRGLATLYVGPAGLDDLLLAG